MYLENLVSDSFRFSVGFRHILAKKSSLYFWKSVGWKFFNHSPAHIVRCVSEYIFLISKNKQAKKTIQKKQKKLKKKNYNKVVIHEKEHTWWTSYKLTKGTGSD